MFDDLEHMPEVAELARAAGFEPSYVDYPAYDLRGAVAAAVRAARITAAGGRRVYAYGESAGGTLAALLAQRRLVEGAATYNLLGFARHTGAPEFYKGLIGADDRLLRRCSPGPRDSEQPILALRPTGDAPWMNAATARWDLRDADVRSVPVAGGHMGDPGDPSIYASNVTHALDWDRRGRLIALARSHYTF